MHNIKHAPSTFLPAWAHKEQRPGLQRVIVGGEWTIAHAAELDRQLKALQLDAGASTEIDATGLGALDTAGVWLLLQTGAHTATTSPVINVAPQFQSIIHTVSEDYNRNGAVVPPDHKRPTLTGFIEGLGRAAQWLTEQIVGVINYVGLVAIDTIKTVLQIRRLRVTAFLHHLEQTGLNALAIVGLLSFAIGIVVAYQGAEQLKKFGAEDFTINLLAIGTLRELGGLMAAIMVAGRSGSAFTAQIGTMKLNQEVDAIEILGLDAISLLVLPRMLGLVVALPILTLYADVMGLLGGGALCYFYLHITVPGFLHQLQTAISVKTLMIGLVKAPVFACIIGLIGCFEGMHVKRDAENLGLLTTRSVVESIFLVIIVDAAFSILFSIMGI